MSDQCPLCLSIETNHFLQDKDRAYKWCRVCDLVFVPKSYHLSEDDEFRRYKHHRNDLNDTGYINYQTKFLSMTKEFWSNHLGRSLDYGCGASSVINEYLKTLGYQTDCYDKYFFSNQDPLTRQYHYVWMSEVWEHLKDPKAFLEWLTTHLISGGFWFVRTSLRPDDSKFKDWYYKNDPTHLIFPSVTTLRWIEQETKIKLVMAHDPFWIFQKQSA